MKKRFLVAAATILCISVSAFIARDAPTLWERVAWYASFALAVILVVVEAIGAYSTDKDLSQVKLDLANAKKYGRYALWNMRGSQSISHDYCLPSEISGWADGFLREKNGCKQIRHDDDAITYYEQIRNEYPLYPFPYYLLAEAYRLRDDSVWRRYAVQAIEIFEITTSLPDHSPDHDQALDNLRTALENEDSPVDEAPKGHARNI